MILRAPPEELLSSSALPIPPLTSAQSLHTKKQAWLAAATAAQHCQSFLPACHNENHNITKVAKLIRHRRYLRHHRKRKSSSSRRRRRRRRSFLYYRPSKYFKPCLQNIPEHGTLYNNEDDDEDNQMSLLATRQDPPPDTFEERRDDATCGTFVVDGTTPEECLCWFYRWCHNNNSNGIRRRRHGIARRSNRSRLAEYLSIAPSSRAAATGGGAATGGDMPKITPHLNDRDDDDNMTLLSSLCSGTEKMIHANATKHNSRQQRGQQQQQQQHRDDPIDINLKKQLTKSAFLAVMTQNLLSLQQIVTKSGTYFSSSDLKNHLTDATNHDGDTLLMAAASLGWKKGVDYLLREKLGRLSDVNAKTGDNVWSIAVRGGNMEVFWCLLTESIGWNWNRRRTTVASDIELLMTNDGSGGGDIMRTFDEDGAGNGAVLCCQ